VHGFGGAARWSVAEVTTRAVVAPAGRAIFEIALRPIAKVSARWAVAKAAGLIAVTARWPVVEIAARWAVAKTALTLAARGAIAKAAFTFTARRSIAKVTARAIFEVAWFVTAFASRRVHAGGLAAACGAHGFAARVFAFWGFIFIDAQCAALRLGGGVSHGVGTRGRENKERNRQVRWAPQALHALELEDMPIRCGLHDVCFWG